MKNFNNQKGQKHILIHNIGTLISGDIDKPVLNADAILINGDVIESVGRYDDLKNKKVQLDIDIQGMTLCPGLIDAHTHPVIGDWAPRIKVIGWMESALHCGVTTLISQGEQNLPGLSRDVVGEKALAILANRMFRKYRPGGIKAYCGAILLEKGITEADIEELAKEGVWLFAEIGLGGLKDINQLSPLVKSAKEKNFVIPVHFGPESIPGSSGLTTDNIIALKPDIIAHFNGGPTACSFSDMEKIAANCNSYLELILNGNPKALNYAVDLLEKRHELHRITVGTDSPTGFGAVPCGVLRLVVQISSLNTIKGEVALAFATGNIAKAYKLNTGIIKPGKQADIIVIDAPTGSVGSNAIEAIQIGDQPTIGMVMVDGEVITRTTKRSMHTAKKVLINGEPENIKSMDDIRYG